MTKQHVTRNDLLSSLYCLLPDIDDDYAAQLVYHLEKSHTIEELKKEIQEIKTELNSSNPMLDTTIAKILLDKITLPAAQLQLRIYSNALAISDLTKALHMPKEDTQLLINYYASFGSPYFFDEQFTAALKGLAEPPNMTDEEKARQAFAQLLDSARQALQLQPDLATQNKKAIYQIANKYHLSVQATAELLAIYTRNITTDFAVFFQQIFSELETLSTHTRLNASLTSRVLRYQLTAEDAQQIAKTSLLLKHKILEEDLVAIACRYLKHKTPQDIVEAFEAVLKRLPHIRQKEENLGLAVKVLLDGTESSFTRAQQEASARREQGLLYKALSKQPIFNGYEKDLANRFGGVKTIVQLEHAIQDLLQQLPYYQTPSENKELACQLLLGTISQQHALQQATTLCAEKALQLQQQLLPQLLESYTGKQSKKAVVSFFTTTLAPFSFWKSNPKAHTFALQVLLKELNGHSSPTISHFILEQLEQGNSIESLQDLLLELCSCMDIPQEVEYLQTQYQQTHKKQGNLK